MFRAYLLAFQGRWAEVIELLQPTVDRCRAEHGSHSYITIGIMYVWALARLLNDSRRFQDAASVMQKVIELAP